MYYICRYKTLLLGLTEMMTKSYFWNLDTDAAQKLKNLLSSCENARLCMHELIIYINRYNKDVEYIEAFNRLDMRNIRDPVSIATKYGTPIFEGRMLVRRYLDDSFDPNIYLLCNQGRILIFAVEKDEENYSVSQECYYFIDSIRITRDIKIQAQNVEKKGCYILKIQENEHKDTGESKWIEIKVRHRKEMEELKFKLSELSNERLFKIEGSHYQHDFELVPYLPMNDSNDYSRLNYINITKNPPAYCEECKTYLVGLVFRGYKCLRCDATYHEHCFEKGRPDDIMGMYFR